MIKVVLWSFILVQVHNQFSKYVSGIASLKSFGVNLKKEHIISGQFHSCRHQTWEQETLPQLFLLFIFFFITVFITAESIFFLKVFLESLPKSLKTGVVLHAIRKHKETERRKVVARGRE